MEMIFSRGFFEIVIHLTIHLCREVGLAGLVYVWWIFGIDRYLCKLKSYVRNRTTREGSIAEGYLEGECLTFSSRFSCDDGEKLKNTYSAQAEVSIPENLGYHVGGRRNKDGFFLMIVLGCKLIITFYSIFEKRKSKA